MAASTKRGLGWDGRNKEQTFIFTKPGSKVSWLYNWSPNPTVGSSINFVPMQWNHVNIEELASKVASAGASTLLGFNEPELDSQSNMPVALAVKEWVRCIEPLRRNGIRCGSPGICSAPKGVAWLKDFLAQIRAQGSDIDFYALHWYGETLGQFYDYIWSAYYQLGPDKPVWITEFAPTNWNESAPLGKEHVESFLRESCKYLDSLKGVERYAWFGAMPNTGNVGKWASMIEGGKLTETGKIYCSC